MTVKLAVNRRITGIAAVSALAVTLAACGGNGGGETTTAAETTGTTEEVEETEEAETTEAPEAGGEMDYSALSGTIAGGGASSMEKAQNGWIATFASEAPGVTVSYNPTGSSGGRTAFIEGTVQYAGTDSIVGDDQLAEMEASCQSDVLELPLYVSPIAVIFNLPGIDSINMTPETIANVFNGSITKWNDEAIAADNEGVDLPDLDIIPVNRFDGSGTTENFTEYLSVAAADAWTYEPADMWPIEGTQSGDGTSGLVDVVTSTEGAIGYADASRAGGLGTVAVGVGEEFVSYSPEAAARILEVSEPTESATDLRLTYDLARDTTESGTYPVVLVSYTLACTGYGDQETADAVKGYLTYVASAEGQEVAADPDVAGIAPISDNVRTQVMAAIDQISAR
ncbi:MAG: phosphate ABC transporter substrate-binding protein PstS [bacterium]|nr:phosphate ABC transporter substrate-binding protein PstS [bacterium]